MRESNPGQYLVTNNSTWKLFHQLLIYDPFNDATCFEVIPAASASRNLGNDNICFRAEATNIEISVI